MRTNHISALGALRIGVLLLLVTAGVWGVLTYQDAYNPDPKKTILGVSETPRQDVPQDARVIGYEQLSEQQQQEFRQSRVRNTEITAGNGVTAGRYIHLDGEYYKITETQVTDWAQFAISSAYAGVSLFVVVGGGVLALMLLSLSSTAYTFLDRSVVEDRVITLAKKVAPVVIALCFLVSVYNISIGYMILGEPVDSVPDESETVVQYESLSSETQERFRSATGSILGAKLTGMFYPGQNTISGDYIQSDGEFYNVGQPIHNPGFFLSPEGLMLLLIYAFVSMSAGIVFGSGVVIIPVLLNFLVCLLAALASSLIGAETPRDIYPLEFTAAENKSAT